MEQLVKLEEKNGAKDRVRSSTSLIADTLRYAPATIFPALMGVAGGAIFTRIFVPSAFGQVILINSVTSPVVTVIAQMFGQPAGRYYSELKNDGMGPAYSNVLSALIQKIILGILGLLLLVSGWIWLIAPSLSNWLFLLMGAIIGMGVQATASLLVPILPLVRDFRGYQWYTLGSAFLSLVIPVALVLWQGPHIVWMIWGGVIAGCIMLVSLIRRTRRYCSIRFFRIVYGETERRIITRFLSYGLPMAAWFFAESMIQRSDRYVIAAFFGSSAVAIYGASYAIASQAIGLLTGPLVTATWPTILTSWAGTHDVVQVRRIISRATELYLMLGIGLIGGAVVVSKDVVGIILSPKYIEGYTIIPPIMAAAVLWGVSMLGHKSMEIMERNDIMLWNMVAAAVMNLGLNVICVPRLGWQIAAYITLLSYLMYATITWVVSKRMIPWDINFWSLGGYLGIAVLSDIVTLEFWTGKSLVLSLCVRGFIFSVLYYGISTLTYLKFSGPSKRDSYSESLPGRKGEIL